MGKVANRVYVLISVILLALVLMGFTKDQTQDVVTIRAFADPMTENILQAMNEDDYEKFSLNFDQPMKNGFSNQKFMEVNPAIKGKVGNYISKELLAVQTKDGYIVVSYRGKFSLEDGDVIITSVFSNDGAQRYISGFWLDSPNLRR